MKRSRQTGTLTYVNVKNSIAVIRTEQEVYFCDLNSNPALAKLGMFPNLEVSLDLATGSGSVTQSVRSKGKKPDPNQLKFSFATEATQ